MRPFTICLPNDASPVSGAAIRRVASVCRRPADRRPPQEGLEDHDGPPPRQTGAASGSGDHLFVVSRLPDGSHSHGDRPRPGRRQEDDFFSAPMRRCPTRDCPTILRPMGRGGMYSGGPNNRWGSSPPGAGAARPSTVRRPGDGVGDTGEGLVLAMCCRRACFASGTDAMEPSQNPALVPGYARGSASYLVATSNFIQLKVDRTSPRNSRNRFLRTCGRRIKWLNPTNHTDRPYSRIAIRTVHSRDKEQKRLDFWIRGSAKMDAVDIRERVFVSKSVTTNL